MDVYLKTQFVNVILYLNNACTLYCELHSH